MYTFIFCEDKNWSSLTTLPLQIIFKLSQFKSNLEIIKSFNSDPVIEIDASIVSTNVFCIFLVK